MVSWPHCYRSAGEVAHNAGALAGYKVTPQRVTKEMKQGKDKVPKSSQGAAHNLFTGPHNLKRFPKVTCWELSL